MKKNKKQEEFLENLRKVPVVRIACDKVGISRMSAYRWRNNDPEFLTAMDEALVEGEAFVNDMTEVQLLNLIKEKNWPAMSFWLRHRHPKFKDKIEITGTIQTNQELTPEQQQLVEVSLRKAKLVLNSHGESQS